MKWGIVGKGDVPHVATAGQAIADLLTARGEDFLLQDRLAEPLGLEGLAMPDLNKEIDMWITVGGDGTVLYCQHFTDKPVLGINAGAVGFLAEAEPEDAAAAVDAVLAGTHTIEERSRLACALGDKKLPDAVNEITLQTSRIAKLIRYRVEADGEELDLYRGDGIIVSTSTGSTGYAMSVGGPLLHPRVDAVVVAPIAPFKLASRPWVVPGNTHLAITLMERDSAQGIQQASCVIDGHLDYAMDTGATLHVTQSEHKARYVRLGYGFYDRVRNKLAR